MTLAERDDGNLLTVAELADQTHVSHYYVRRAIRGGTLDAIRLGGRAGYRIRPMHAELWIRAGLPAPDKPTRKS